MSLLQSIVPTLGRISRVASSGSNPTNEFHVKPAYLLRENAEAFEVVVQLPGVAKEGLEITTQEGQITVTGRQAWTPPAEWTTLYRETPRANYQLTLAHGSETDAGKITAELKDGILRLTLPKAEAANHAELR